MESKTLGAPQQTLRPPLPKAILNLILVGLGVLAGAILMLSNLAVIGLPIALVCLGLGFVIIRRQIGRSITIHEHGITVKTMRGTAEWHLDKMDDVRIGVTGSRYRNRVIAYILYAGDQEVVAIGSSFPDWQQVGERLTAEVVRRTTERHLKRISAGESVIIPHITFSGLVNNPKRQLTISRAGLQVDDEPLIAWGDIQSIEVNDSYATGWVRIIHGDNKRLVFQYFATRGSVIARNLINGVRPQS